MRILIIDDEALSRKVLLKQLEGIGDCTAVNDSLKGFELLEKAMGRGKPYDLVTLDVSMPKMGGIELLKKIRKAEKDSDIGRTDWVKIIMVSSRMNVTTIKECIRLGCSSYLVKPVNRFRLMDAMGKIGFQDLPEENADKDTQSSAIVARIIKNFYAGKINLPILPSIVNDVESLLSKEDPSIDDLAQIVKKDILISSKLISIANSALYKGMEKVDSLNSALLRLGLRASSAMISSITAKDMFKSDNAFVNNQLQRLWIHSFSCACFAKRLGEELQSPNPDSLFLMGIVHDIGKMLLVKAVSDLDPEERFEKEMQTAIHEIHTTFGAALLKKMRFGVGLVHITEFHHMNEFSEDDEQSLVIIRLADEIAVQIGHSFFSTDIDQESATTDLSYIIKTAGHLNLKKQTIAAIIEETKKVINEGMAVV